MKSIVNQIRFNRQAVFFTAVFMTMSGLAVAQEEEASADADAEAAPADTAADVAPEPETPPPAPEPEPAAESEAATVSVSIATPAPAAEAESAATEEEKSAAGVNVDVGVSSIYNFRGLNSFQESSQQDQNAMFAPSVTWSIFDTGLYLGYWGAYQLTGGNKTEMVQAALGHEQDLYIGYDLGLADDLVTLSFAFTYFFYPFADEDVAGTANPSIIEPLVGISLATVLDLGLKVSYFHGLQDELKTLRYAYFNFSVGKGFEFNNIFGMNLGASFGIKAYVEDVDYNRFDLAFDWSIPIKLTEQLYLEPGVHLAWTDLKEVSSGMDDDPATTDTDESVRKATAGDEYMVYWSINVGADF